jgi:pilus assembly protein CpaE
VTGSVGIIGHKDNQLADLVRAAGLRTMPLDAEQLTSTARAVGVPPDVVLVDVRRDRTALGAISLVKRRHPSIGVAIVVQVLEPELMLEAMRAGVTEVLTEPLTQAALEAAISRLMGQRVVEHEGRVIAVIGAKGGVGATTIAVNLAEAFAKANGDSLLVDLNLANGDAAVFLGVEPRFTILEALENTHRLDEAFLRGLVVHTPSGLDLLASSTRIANSPADPQRVRTLIDFAARHYRCVILDVPRLELPLIDSLEAASSVFVVVNHELPTVRSAHRLVSMLRQRYGERVSVIVNRADRLSEISLEDIKKAVNVPVSHVFPNDYRGCVSAANKGRPIASSSDGKLAESFHSFVRALTGARSKKTSAEAEESSRLFGWLSPRKSAG